MPSMIIYNDCFLENKYQKVYFQIINFRRNNKIPETSYSEVHHIIPKSIGGQNNKSNLIAVTAREHFILHWLLTKMCEGQHKYKMLEAFSIFQNNKKRGIRLTQRKIQQLREANAIAASVRSIGNQAWRHRSPASPERLLQYKEYSSKCRWINDGVSEKFEIDHEEYIQTGEWKYGRIKRDSPREAYKRLTCEFCNRTITEHNHRIYHGDMCDQNPNNIHIVEEKRKQKEEKKLLEKLERSKIKKDQQIFKCEHCQYETTNAANFSRWHGKNCKHNPEREKPLKIDHWNKKKESLPLLTCIHCGFQSKIRKNMELRHGDNCKKAPILSDYRIKQKNKSLLKCEHCGFETKSGSAFKNHHGDNCKHNPAPSPEAIEFRKRWQEKMQQGQKNRSK